jgi:hypothetical protein
VGVYRASEGAASTGGDRSALPNGWWSRPARNLMKGSRFQGG